MAKLITFLSDLVDESKKASFKLQVAFVKNPEAVMQKRGLSLSQRQAVLSKSRTKILRSLASELVGLGQGNHPPHW